MQFSFMGRYFNVLVSPLENLIPTISLFHTSHRSTSKSKPDIQAGIWELKREDTQYTDKHTRVC